MPYNDALGLVQDGKVASATVTVNDVVLQLQGEGGKPGERVSTARLPGVQDEPLVTALVDKHVRLTAESPHTPWWLTALFWILPLVVINALFFYAARRAGQGPTSGPLSFLKTRTRVYDRAHTPPVRFSDVEGVDEAKEELVEVVDFLKRPERYRALGGRIPRGLLLIGPPGTGKTLLARAVAGEAEVPFFSLNASEFVEMFVGLGAARVRDLFDQAKKSAPSIVFIDEINAVGRTRGGISTIASHDEREQTLQQLLAELDGFDARTTVILMAATNRPEVLDPALLRPGRFDRQVIVDRPDLAGRAAILHVHARKLPLANDVDLEAVARRTPGMAGADLANIVNEAALAAARRGGSHITMADFYDALDRVQLGLRRKGIIMTPAERRRVAYHESGHAICALSLPNANPVERVSIVARTIGALGTTIQVPRDERHVATEQELLSRVTVLLGGRAAEENRARRRVDRRPRRPRPRDGGPAGHGHQAGHEQEARARHARARRRRAHARGDAGGAALQRAHRGRDRRRGARPHRRGVPAGHGPAHDAARRARGRDRRPLDEGDAHRRGARRNREVVRREGQRPGREPGGDPRPTRRARRPCPLTWSPG